MQCRDFRDIADSYLGDELLVETNHEVFRHLESCADCRRELQARREVRARLRSAFMQSAKMQPGEEFVAHLHAQLRSTARGEASSSWRASRMWLAIAACLVVAGAVGLFSGKFRVATQTDSTTIAVRDGSDQPRSGQTLSPAPPLPGVATVLASMTHDAVGDHRDCAVDYRLAETPIPLAEAGEKYDRAYLGISEAVMAKRASTADDVEFVESHSCIFNGRRFAHVVLKQRGRLVSVLVTDLEYSEARAAQLDQTNVTAASYRLRATRRLSGLVFRDATPRRLCRFRTERDRQFNARACRRAVRLQTHHARRGACLASRRTFAPASQRSFV